MDGHDQLVFFPQALTFMGASSTDRARLLGVSRRSVKRYEQNQLPQVLLVLIDHPLLLGALLLDAILIEWRRKALEDVTP